jgi:hypothetical protein
MPTRSLLSLCGMVWKRGMSLGSGKSSIHWVCSPMLVSLPATIFQK